MFDSGAVLGYVTPWNSHGYDVAQMFNSKFSLISPVWLQLLPKSKKGGRFTLGGLQDVDPGWIRNVRGSSTKIVPRVLFDHWTGRDFMGLFQDKKERLEVAQLLTDTLEEQDFDGLVLEVWSQLGGQARSEISEGHMDRLTLLWFLFETNCSAFLAFKTSVTHKFAQ